MLLFRVFSIPVRFFIALLIYFSWGPLAGGVVTAPVPEFSSPALIPYPSKVVRGAGEAGFRSVHVKVGSDVPGRDDLMKEIKAIFRTSGIQGSLNSGGAAEGAMTWELFPDARMKGEGYDLSVGLGKATVRAGSFGGFLTLFKRCGNWFSIEKGNLPCLLCVLVTNPLSSCGELCWMWGVITCLLP